MVLQICTHVTGRSDRRITYAWFYNFVHMLLVDQIGGSHMHGSTICTYVTGRSDRRIAYAWFYSFVHMLLVDQIGGSQMHGYTGFGHKCYW
jgi:hypothetical protein